MLSSFFQSQTDLPEDYSVDSKSENVVAIEFLDESKHNFFSGVEISVDLEHKGLQFVFNTRQPKLFSNVVLNHFENCDLTNLSMVFICNLIESQKLRFNQIVKKAVLIKSFLKCVSWDDGLSDVITQPMNPFIDLFEIEILVDVGGFHGEYLLSLHLSHDVDNWILLGEIKVVFGGQAFDVSKIGSSQIASGLGLDFSDMDNPNNTYLHTWEYQKSALYRNTCDFFLECLGLCENHYCSFL
jgi:hypothetical protein